ncbi:MAG: helix-turn-helix domain-containing protein [Pirellulaceae bacterium]|nr:helix-turn-helix domain-containing protein [Pirellulaceae bacterium]
MNESAKHQGEVLPVRESFEEKRPHKNENPQWKFQFSYTWDRLDFGLSQKRHGRLVNLLVALSATSRPVCRPGIWYLCKKMNLSRRSVQRYLRLAEGFGILARYYRSNTRGFQRSNEYEINYDILSLYLLSEEESKKREWKSSSQKNLKKGATWSVEKYQNHRRLNNSSDGKKCHPL